MASTPRYGDHSGTQGKPRSLETGADEAATDAARCRPLEDAGQPAVTTQLARTADGPGGTGGKSLPTLPISPAIEDAIVHRVSQGSSAVAAAEAAGIPRRTWQRWMAIGEGRLTVYESGYAIDPALRAFMTRVAQRIARTQAETEARLAENIYQAGFTVGKSGVPEWRAHLELLKHSEQWRQRWYEYREQRIEHAGTINHELRQASRLSDAELLELAPGEWRALVPDDDAHARG